MEERTHPPMIAPHLIGRTSQLAALQRLVEQTKRGEGHLALINGEAGVGKSRLITEIKSLAISQGFLLLQGNCFPIDLTCPYAPLLDLLRALFASQLAIPFAIELDKLAHDLFPLLPELVPEQVASQLPLEPEQEKRRLFAVLANFFTRLSASSPLLLVIEDVHWSDSTSLDFLHMLARRAISHPLLLLVTYRQDEMRAELSNWLTQLNRERLAETIPLLPLSRNDIDLMLSSLFDQQHTAFDMRRFLHGELLELLYTLTEGNPFFVEETLSAMIAVGDIFYTQGYWNRKSKLAAGIPQSAQDAVQQRTQHLGEAAKQVLMLAAVAGRHFDFALLQQLTGYDEDHLLLIMKELVSAQLVVEVSSEQFAFRHPLTRRAIYTQLLARERMQVHARIGETMEQQERFALDMHVEDLATHFYQGRQWQKAMDYAQRAGEKALQLYSHRAAIEYFTWALEAASHLSSPSAMFYRVRGHAYETLGEFEQAHHDYTQASNAARTLNDRITEWQSAIDLGFLWVGRDYAQAEPWFRLSLTLAQSLDEPALHAHSLNRIGNWHINVEQPQEALRYHREALAIFEGLHDTRGIAETLDLLGMASYLSGDLIGGTAYYRQAITLFTNLGDKSGLTSSLATLSLRGPTFQTDSLVADASLAEAYLDVERALRIAREIGHRSDEAYALFQIGLCLGSQGEYGRSFEEAKLSLEIAEEIEHRQWQTAAHSILGGIYTWLFAYPQANEQFEQTLALAHESGSLVWTRIATGYLASLAILRHDPAQAERLLYGTLNADSPAETMAQRMLWCASVELELAQGRPARALAIIDRLIASGQRTEGRNSLRILKLRGEALTGLQRLDEAEIAYEQARDIASMHGVRPMYWRICVALGRLHQKQRKNSEAEQAFGTARTLIEELAATIPGQSLRENFLQQALTMLPHTRQLSTREVAKQAYGGLTTREREIAALIAQEKYNREIAELLVLSERTVETHVSNIMFKLGFTSRRQIAMWANERGLSADR